MTIPVTLSGPAIRSLLRIDASRLLRFAEEVTGRDFEGESFAARMSGELREIAQDLAALVADVEALEKTAS